MGDGGRGKEKTTTRRKFNNNSEFPQDEVTSCFVVERSKGTYPTDSKEDIFQIVMELGACSTKVDVAGSKADTRKDLPEVGVVGVGKMALKVGKEAMDLRKIGLGTT